ncbi:MAG: sugar ABC transporter substrate-binding protein [Meiothermus sp.]|nr:sugar ABC transporter substrate-binding protein [Meiothermus sp.]
MKNQVLLTALAATALTGVASAQVKVTLWSHSGQGIEREVIDATVKKFNEANKDIQIDLVRLPEGSYNDQVNAAALANRLPCVLDFDGPNLYNYAWSGKIIPIDKYINAATRADFLPSIISQGTYNGKLYTLAVGDSGLAIWANRSLLAKAGVTIPNRPWTGNEFVQVLTRLKASGLQYPLDMKFNYGRGEWYTYGFAPIMQSFGGDLINRNGYQTASGVINGPAAVRGMTYFQNLTKNFVNVATRSDTDFVEGRAAISFVGHWTWADYSKALGDNLLLLPMPAFGGRQVTGMGGWNYGISSDCPNPDAAAKVLLHMVSTESVLAMSDAAGGVPSRKSAIARSKNFGPNGALSLYVRQLNSRAAVARPATPAYPAITKAFAEAAANIAAGGNVKAELDRAARAIDQDIKDNNGYPNK